MVCKIKNDGSSDSKMMAADLLGLRHKARIIHTLFWMPFDVRFSKILERFEEHPRLYNNELGLVYNQQTLSNRRKMDEEFKKNSQHRQDMQDEISTKQELTLSTQFQ